MLGEVDICSPPRGKVDEIGKRGPTNNQVFAARYVGGRLKIEPSRMNSEIARTASKERAVLE